MKNKTLKILFGLICAGYGYYLLTIVGVVKASVAVMLFLGYYLITEENKEKNKSPIRL